MKTNFEKWRDSLTPDMLGDLIETENSELGGCTYCPKGCRKLCKAHAAEFEKMNCGEPYDEKLAFLFGCKDIFLAWANAPVKEEETK